MSTGTPADREPVNETKGSPAPTEAGPGKIIRVRHCDETDEDIDIYYEAYGNPSNPALLFVAGLGAQCLDWDVELLEMMAARNFYCIRFDNRDIGYSSHIKRPEPKLWKFLLPACCCCCCPEKAPYSLDAMATDAVALLDALGIKQAHIIGQSMGGMISQLICLNYPERVLTGTFVFTNTGNRSIQDPPFGVKLWLVKAPKSKNHDDLLEHHFGFEKNCQLTGTNPDEEYTRPRVINFFKRSCYVDGKANQAAAIVTAPMRDKRLKEEIKMPILIIHGDKDVLVPLKNGQHLHSCIPHSHMVTVQGMSHYVGPNEHAIIEEELVKMAKQVGHSA